MREGSWFSRLLGRQAEGQGAPLIPVWREGSADDAEYRAHRGRVSGAKMSSVSGGLTR